MPIANPSSVSHVSPVSYKKRQHEKYRQPESNVKIQERYIYQGDMGDIGDTSSNDISLW
jgi:hypothetical protein